ncbi:hypothetical protein COOONC_23609 [Cooperia oncophora]
MEYLPGSHHFLFGSAVVWLEERKQPSANAAIASARRDANRVIDSVINNLNNLMNENRPRSRSSETPAAKSPFLQTAEEKTAGYPTARTASFHGTASEQ